MDFFSKEIPRKKTIRINYLPTKRYPDHCKSVIIDDIPDYTSLHAEHYKLNESEKMFNESYFWYCFNPFIDYGDNLSDGDILLFKKDGSAYKGNNIYLVQDQGEHKIIEIKYDFIKNLYTITDKTGTKNIYEKELPSLCDSLIGVAVKVERYL